MASVDKVKFQDILGRSAPTMSGKENKSPEDIAGLLLKNNNNVNGEKINEDD